MVGRINEGPDVSGRIIGYVIITRIKWTHFTHTNLVASSLEIQNSERLKYSRQSLYIIAGSYNHRGKHHCHDD